MAMGTAVKAGTLILHICLSFKEFASLFAPIIHSLDPD